MKQGKSAATLSPKQTAAVLRAAVHAAYPVLLWGAPGVGKSDIVTQVAHEIGATLIISHPVTQEPVDVRGLPWPAASKKTATFLPFGDLAKVLSATKPTIWFLDDLGQAPASVQAAYMQLLLSRRIGEHVLPPSVTIIAATNGREHRSGVNGILECVKSRFVTIIEVRPTLDDWVQWAVLHGIRPEVVAFLRWQPDLLLAFPDRPNGLEASPSPRTWAHVSALLDLHLPPDILPPVLAGAVGAPAAEQFLGFLRVWDKLPDLDSALQNPDTVAIPSEISAKIAFCEGIAARASTQTFPAISRILSRLEPEYAAFLLKSAYLRCPAIADTEEFEAISEGPLGAVIRGEVVS